MTTHEVPALAGLTGDDARQRVDEIATACGLRISLEGTLATDPGSLHWHFKYGEHAGVLELTISPRSGRAVLSIHQNRMRDWIPAAVESFINVSESPV